MASESPANELPPLSHQSSHWRRAVVVFALIVGAYLLVAYYLMPLFWTRYYHRHPALENAPRIRRFSSRRTARSRPRPKTCTASSEHRSRPAK